MSDACKFCGSQLVNRDSILMRYECGTFEDSTEPHTRVCYERNVRRSLSKIERSIDEILAFIKRFDNK